MLATQTWHILVFPPFSSAMYGVFIYGELAILISSFGYALLQSLILCCANKGYTNGFRFLFSFFHEQQTNIHVPFSVWNQVLCVVCGIWLNINTWCLYRELNPEATSHILKENKAEHNLQYIFLFNFCTCIHHFLIISIWCVFITSPFWWPSCIHCRSSCWMRLIEW